MIIHVEYNDNINLIIDFHTAIYRGECMNFSNQDIIENWNTYV